MQNPNLASIESIQDEIIDLSITAESFSYKSWFPELEKWENALKLSCRELQSFDPFISDEFKLLKTNVQTRLLRLQNELKVNCNAKAINIIDDEEMLLGVYEEIIQEIDSLNDLYRDDLYTILFITLDKFLCRFKDDDYSEFYELSAVGETLKKVASITNKQYAFIFYFMDEDISRGNIINLIEKYKIKGKSLDIKKNGRFYQDCLDAWGEIKSFRNDEAIKSKDHFSENLRVALEYVTKLDESKAIEKANRLLDKLDSKK